MFEQTLSADTKSNLAAIGQTPLARQYYLAGGTAVALHLGSRFSFDLDFFSKEHISIDVVLQTLRALEQIETFRATADTLNGRLNGYRISFFIYPYPVLEPFAGYAGVQIASLTDLAAMKVDAFNRRGTKRDFVDLYFICQRSFPLDKALELLFQKFKDYNINPVNVFKSLVYFGDAEKDDTQQMIEKVPWREVKGFIQKESQSLYRSKVS
jgi:predicted nucleotidyltransferase component of viral defense system